MISMDVLNGKPVEVTDENLMRLSDNISDAMIEQIKHIAIPSFTDAEDGPSDKYGLGQLTCQQVHSLIVMLCDVTDSELTKFFKTLKELK